ncbi:aspartate carbamoyltransferase regulatory subunit [Pseudomonadota bacterium]
MNEKMQVEAICQGTVIDHITTGQGLKILNRLQLINDKIRLTVGLNLPSGQFGSKDIIKVDNWMFSKDEAYELALLAPNATVNIIEDYKVVSKFHMELPEILEGIFSCPNSNCITHSEPVDSKFTIKTEDEQVQLRCHYCEELFNKQLFTENSA